MENYKKFSHKECEFYPCHNIEDMNCLFCYCPLYSDPLCGGNFSILNSGIKDCSKCIIPHSENGYNYVLARLLK